MWTSISNNLGNVAYKHSLIIPADINIDWGKLCQHDGTPESCGTCVQIYPDEDYVSEA